MDLEYLQILSQKIEARQRNGDARNGSETRKRDVAKPDPSTGSHWSGGIVGSVGEEEEGRIHE